VTVAEPLPGALPAGGAAGERPAMPIDFATALALTAGQNPRIAFAQAQVDQAFAQYSAARVLWLPSLRTGMNYNKHEGEIQDVIGFSFPTSRGAAYGGLGAGAVGAGSPAVPGIYAQFHLSDAILQRQITGFALDARQWQSEAAINDQLLETALAYLAVLEALQRKAIAVQTAEHGQELAVITASFFKAGAGTQADADRAAAAAAILQNEVTRADEAIAVASARLSQQLSTDPSYLLAPQEPAVVPIELVRLDAPQGELVATGLSNRPELAASRSLVCEAVSRLRREQHAPWLPSVILGASYGAFGAGIGGRIDGGERFDFDGVAYWELRNLGFGERAARENAAAQIQQARMREVELLDTVAREVVEAQAQVQARRKLIDVAKGAITSAEDSYRRNLERIRNAQGLPIEVLQSIQALDQARREYLRSVVEYNQAQFRLHRALGWPISGTDHP
jgi:outer membrane protein TolC